MLAMILSLNIAAPPLTPAALKHAARAIYATLKHEALLPAMMGVFVIMLRDRNHHFGRTILRCRGMLLLVLYLIEIKLAASDADLNPHDALDGEEPRVYIEDPPLVREEGVDVEAVVEH